MTLKLACRWRTNSFFAENVMALCPSKCAELKEASLLYLHILHLFQYSFVYVLQVYKLLKQKMFHKVAQDSFYFILEQI